MKLGDLDEVKRLALQRAKLLPEIVALTTADSCMVDLVSKADGVGVLKVPLVNLMDNSPDDILFHAVCDVLVMGFQKRLAKIDARLAELGVTI